MYHNFIKAISFVTAGLLLASCSAGISNGERQAKTYEVRHPIAIEEKQNSLEIPLTTSLSEAEEAKIKSFLYDYDRQNNSHLVITVPETGEKVSSARIAVKNIISLADKAGIHKKNIRVGTYKPFNNNMGAIRMSFESVVARAPDCSNSWSENLADAYNNDLSKGFGCSTRKNLAAMIVNPLDLVKMRSIGSGNSARRVDAFDKYVLGQATGASRDSSETAQSTGQ